MHTHTFWKALGLCFLMSLGAKSYGQCPINLDLSPADGSTFCATETIQFTVNLPNNRPGLVYEWDFGDGSPTSNDRNPSHRYDFFGTGANVPIRAMLTVRDTLNNCSAIQDINLNINEQPEVDFFEQNGFRTCNTSINDPTQTVATIFNNSPSPNSYSYTIDWDDGAGLEPISLPFNSIDHTYNGLGIYNIRLITTSLANGCTTESTFSYSFDLFPTAVLRGPLAGTFDNCEPSEIEFENLSENVSATTTLTLEFGDGTSTSFTGITGNTISHIYLATCQSNGNNPGLSVRLIAENRCDRTESVFSPLRIYAPPQASFTPTPSLLGCVNEPMDFTNNTIPNFCANNTRTDYTWDWGDGQTQSFNSISESLSPQQQIDHTFANPGVYDVTLTASNTSSNGCGSSDTTIQVTICPNPVSSFTTQFNSQTFSSDQTCSTTLNFGCPSQALALSNASPTGICQNNYLWSVDLENGVGAYEFSSGSMTTSSLENESIRFLSGGTYTIRLRVANGSTCNPVETCIRVVVDNPPAVPTIQGLQAIYCPDDTVSLSTILGPGVDSISWDIEDANGIKVLLTSPNDLNQQTRLPIGQYQVKLNAFNACGSSADSASFEVQNPPPAEILRVEDLILVCQGDTAILLAQGGSGFSYQWVLDGTDIPGATQQDLIVSTAGFYQVRVRQGSCDSLSPGKQVSIVPPLTVNISASGPIEYCEGDTIQTLLSVDTPDTLNYRWFRNGMDIPNSDTTQIIASETGVYMAILLQAGGCSDLSNEIIISQNPLPSINFIQEPFILCDTNLVIPITGASPANGVWAGQGIVDSLNGTFNPALAGGLGTYPVSYTVTDPLTLCTNTDTLEVEVVAREQAIAGRDIRICENEMPLQLNGFPNGGRWQVINNTTTDDLGGDSFDPAIFGLGSFSLIYVFGQGFCETRDTLSLVVLPAPTVEAGPPLEFCEDASPVTLSSQSPTTGGVGTWAGAGVLANGDFTPASAAIGLNPLVYSFQDSITSCINTDTLLVTIHPLASPDFSPDSVYCINELIDFSNNTPDIPGYTLSYAWDFGDGNTSSLRNGQNQYDSIGTYTIRLTVTTSPGNCSQDFSQTIRIAEPPQASFTQTIAPGDACGDVVANFNNTSVSLGNLTYFWDFGNGQTSTEENPRNISFPASLIRDTTYQITLSIVEEGLGAACSGGSFVDSITVQPLPKANFIFVGDFNPICSGFPLPFDNFSFGNPSRFEWDFGDGKGRISTDTSLFTHTFFYEGDTDTTFNVSLKAFNACGVDSITRAITVLPNTVRANMELDMDTTGCAPHTVLLKSNQSGFNRVDWFFGDGNFAIDAPDSITYTYTTPGEYTLVLAVQNGCNVDTSRIKIRVLASPEARFTGDTRLCLDEAFQFENNSDPSLAASWNFGDSTTFFGRTPPPHFYEEAGNYVVTLTVRDPQNGCTHTSSLDIEVINLPVADFEAPVNACQGEEVPFTNTSTGAIQYVWDFGEPNADPTASNPTHRFTQIGRTEVTLIAYNGFSCTDTLRKSIRILPSPVPQFRIIPDTSCISPVTIHLENLTSFPNAGQGNFVWDLGNGQTHTGFTPPRDLVYLNETDTIQPIIIRLTITNGQGCSATSEQVLEVCPKPCEARVLLPNAFTPNGDGLNDTFKPASVALKNYRLQIFNRWGEEIYQGTDPDMGWNGQRSDGSLYQEDMYIYKITYSCGEGQQASRTGDLLLIHKN